METKKKSQTDTHICREFGGKVQEAQEKTEYER